MLIDYVRVYDLTPNAQSPFLGSPHAVPGRVEAEAFDNGGAAIAYNDCDATNNGGEFRTIEGVDIEASAEGGFNIGWLCGGEWVEYTIDVAAAGNYLIQTRAASNATGGSFHLEFDGEDKTGSVSVPVSGGWQTWTTVSVVAALDAGQQVLRFANESGVEEYNLNYFDFFLLAPSDLDLDGDTDLADYAILSDCVAGPDISLPPAGCSAEQFGLADLDEDGDVDLDDYGSFGAEF